MLGTRFTLGPAECRPRMPGMKEKNMADRTPSAFRVSRDGGNKGLSS